MSITTLNIISEAMESLGLSYSFMDAPAKPSETYYTGEYIEIKPVNEDGLQESTFLISGFTIQDWLALERDKEKIEAYFPKVGGKKVIAKDGSAVAIFYSDSFPVRTVDSKIKKIQINLDVKEWSVK